MERESYGLRYYQYMCSYVYEVFKGLVSKCITDRISFISNYHLAHTHTHTHTHSLPLVRTMDDVMHTKLRNCKQFQFSTAMCLLVTRLTVQNTAHIICRPSPTSEF